MANGGRCSPTRSAYQQNLGLRIAAIRILEARAQLGIAVGNLYPQQQEASGGVVYQTNSENQANTAFGDLSFTNFDIGLDVAWEVDFWGKFRRGIESADANFYSSIADYDDVLVSLTADVANAYVLIRTFEERLKLARSNVAIQQRSMEIADVRFRNGATTELDVQQAKTLLFNTQASIPRLEAGLRQAKNALGILLGLPPGDLQGLLGEPAAIPSAPDSVAVGIPADLLRRRPDVRIPRPVKAASTNCSTPTACSLSAARPSTGRCSITAASETTFASRTHACSSCW